MDTQKFLRWCVALPVAWVLALLLIPGFADVVEQVMLGFLATSA